MAIVEAETEQKIPRFQIVKSLVSSQIKIHAPFGGVVPNLAKREHIKNLPVLFKRLIGKNPAETMKEIDFITVTVGPGLEPALWTGITFAQNISKEYKKPLVGANHLEGHLYSFLLAAPEENHDNLFPAAALIVSGGHTILLLMEDLKTWKKLGETRDDAAGEAFDKVSRLLNLPYPGGPQIEKLSAKGDPSAVGFPRPMIYDKNYDFSFSGLKTSVLYFMRDHKDFPRHDIAASFQQAAIDVLVGKTVKAAREFNAKSIVLCGGVAANKALRKFLKKEAVNIGCNFFVPEFKFNTDNAVMIAVAGCMAHLRKKKFPLKANGNLSI
jgi:N6-L-threonylcarbamoyladenine synthase